MQRSFVAGEIGPTLYAGADQPHYQAALATCRNFLVMRHGGVANRPGSEFVAEVKSSALPTYLLKFVFNNSQSYLIEAGNQYFRLFQLGAAVTVGVPAAWSSVASYVAGDVVAFSGVNYYCVLAHLNHTPPNATYWYVLPGSILEIPTPYQTADLARLKFIQSGDIVTLIHPSYPPAELRRFANRWTLTAISTAPAIAAPVGVAAVHGGAGALNYRYVVTAVAAGTYEESVQSAPGACTCVVPTPAAPNTLSWTAVAGAVQYNVYLDNTGNGVYGLVGVAASNAFNDTGVTPDASNTPPVSRTLFANAGDYPQCATYWQQRLIMAGSNNEPYKAYGSRTGFFKNFGIHSPIQDDDAVSFTPIGRKFGEIRHMLEAGFPLLLTSTAEWLVQGGPDGILLPTAINPKEQSETGASYTSPVVVTDNVIYVQARGALVRDLKLNLYGTKLQGRDLTVFSPHLFEGFSIDRMDYAAVPHSIAWCVRSDGTLLGLTYLAEFDVWGWHRHDTDGFYEDVCCIPETTPPVPGSTSRGKEEDAVYVIVRRTIGGVTKRYIERFASRTFDDYRLDAIFLDSSLTYNGINASATTVTLSTGTDFTAGESITVTASASAFTSGDVGNGITVWIPGGHVVRIMVDTYVSGTVVQGAWTAEIPQDMQGVATTNWSRAVNSVSGLAHLEGKTVGVLANGVPSTSTVNGGALTLKDVYDIIHVGLPIVADFETLDLDSVQQEIRDKKKLMNGTSLLVNRSRGILAGQDFTHLAPFQESIGDELGLDILDPAGGKVHSELLELSVFKDWTKAARICVRQTDPLPLEILGVIRNGQIGG